MQQIFVNQKYHEVDGEWHNDVQTIQDESIDTAVNFARHQFHTFMSTYAYGEQPEGKLIDFVSCSIEDTSGIILAHEVDNRIGLVKMEENSPE